MANTHISGLVFQNYVTIGYVVMHGKNADSNLKMDLSFFCSNDVCLQRFISMIEFTLSEFFET